MTCEQAALRHGLQKFDHAIRTMRQGLQPGYGVCEPLLTLLAFVHQKMHHLFGPGCTRTRIRDDKDIAILYNKLFFYLIHIGL